MLPVGEANDAGDAVRRTEPVRDVELLESEHARAARRQLIQRRAAHAADADDDHVIHAQSAQLYYCIRMKLIARMRLWSRRVAGRAHAQEPAAKVEPLHFHHVHLNSMDPAAAAAYYPKPFAQSATRRRSTGSRR